VNDQFSHGAEALQIAVIEYFGHGAWGWGEEDALYSRARHYAPEIWVSAGFEFPRLLVDLHPRVTHSCQFFTCRIAID
jgi:hypothetical protein